MGQSASFTPYSSTLGAMSIGVKQYKCGLPITMTLPHPMVAFASEESLDTVRACTRYWSFCGPRWLH